jgi:hypothetical protein
MLTKKFFLKEQRLVVLICIAAAMLVGSLQTAYIVKSIDKEKW